MFEYLTNRSLKAATTTNDTKLIAPKQVQHQREHSQFVQQNSMNNSNKPTQHTYVHNVPQINRIWGTGKGNIIRYWQINAPFACICMYKILTHIHDIWTTTKQWNKQIYKKTLIGTPIVVLRPVLRYTNTICAGAH